MRPEHLLERTVDGALHTEFYLSRPAADVAAQPLSTLALA